MVFKFLSDENKKEITEGLNELKKEWNNLKKEVGVYIDNDKSKVNEDINKEDSNKEVSRPKTKIEKRKETLRKNLGTINSLAFLFFLLLAILAINLFINDKPFLGVVSLLVIPFFICLEIYWCLKYTNMTLKDHYEFLEKKYGKENIEVFIAISFGVIMLLFMLVMIIIVI